MVKDVSHMAEKDSSKKAAQKAGKPKKKRSIAKFFREVSSEMKKVSWPSFKELTNYTGVVILFILLSAAIIGALDYVVVKLLSPLLK
ncbi:MAG: preprotein translocase subunit SecE [Xylanivirga thermophila]|uniref:preprotein translocase subunit SecE n=1 Tax=Xylanivirga thermophila TaxID=2496273 RepID=UPI001A9388E8|nr:preprotein translocase subunit SecE [Xylanivirga thermophila]